MVRWRVAVLGLAVVALSACESTLLFKQDHRVTVTSPGNFSTVSQPVVFHWSARDFVAPRDGRFALFLDRDPMPPGQTIEYFKRENRRDIYVLDETQLGIDRLVPRPGGSALERNHHDVTVVLLDRAGRRIGESAGFAEFNVRP